MNVPVSNNARQMQKACLMLMLLLPASMTQADPSENSTSSVHAGFLYPNGVDLAGYTNEARLTGYNKLYRYYTFGIPALAAAGIAHYQDYNGNGLMVSGGAGIGFIVQAAAAYQWQLAHKQFIRLGAGWAAGIAYSGFYPAISYEYRLE